MVLSQSTIDSNTDMKTDSLHFVLELQRNEEDKQNPFILRIETPLGIFETEIPVTEFAIYAESSGLAQSPRRGVEHPPQGR